MDFLTHLTAARILVAESRPEDMAATAGILEEAGYNVQKAYYAGDALFALANNPPDAAVIDARMSDRDRRVLVEQLERFKTIPWIALVDIYYPEPQRLLRLGAASTLLRPFRPEGLLKQIGSLLNGEEPPAASAVPGDRTHAEDFDNLLQQRLVEQQTLSALARSLSAVLDLDTLLAQIVDAAVRLSAAEEGLLLLPDEEGKALYVRAFKGIDSETARNFRIKTQDTLAGQVFWSGKPVLVGDQGWQKVKTEYLVKSLLYVPLSLKGETIGVMGVNNRTTDRTFTPHDMDLLQDLAAHAVIAIENARLYEESVLRTRELSTLVEAGEAANSTLAIDRVLSIIAGQLIGALNVSQCYVAEWVPEERRLGMLAVSYRALWRAAEGPSLDVRGNPAIEQAFAQRRPSILGPARAHSDQPETAWLSHRYLAQNVVHIPLFTQDHPIGLVTLYHLSAPYAEAAYAHAPSVLLQQTALETVINLASPDAGQHQDALFRVAQRLIDLAGADWCEIALWNPARRQFMMALSYGEAIWREEAKPGLDLTHFPQVSDLLAAQETFTGLPSGDWQRLTEMGHGKSCLGIPLVIKGKTTGLVVLTDTVQKRYFSRREVQLAQALVGQAANALDNARLFRDLELSLEELRRTQDMLVQTARLTAMGELSAAVAHQINNPLTTILGESEMLLQDVQPGDPSEEALQAISRAGKRAHEVVRRLLAMARQQMPDEVIEAVDVNETITNTLTLTRSHLQQGGVLLEIALDPDLPRIVAIRGQLEDVWLNLLINARDAVVGRAGPQIGVTTAYNSARDCVEVTVWDNGIGIPPELQKRIFEPFFTTKRSGEGTGLGLHICRQIIEKCQGSLRVESAYNEGTRFIIDLPAYHRQERE